MLPLNLYVYDDIKTDTDIIQKHSEWQNTYQKLYSTAGSYLGCSVLVMPVGCVGFLIVLVSFGSYLALSPFWQAAHEGRTASASPPISPHVSAVATGEDTFFKTKKATQN